MKSRNRITPKKVRRRMALDKWQTGKKFRIDYQEKDNFKKKRLEE